MRSSVVAAVLADVRGGHLQPGLWPLCFAPPEVSEPFSKSDPHSQVWRWPEWLWTWQVLSAIPFHVVSQNICKWWCSFFAVENGYKFSVRAYGLHVEGPRVNLWTSMTPSWFWGASCSQSDTRKLGPTVWLRVQQWDWCDHHGQNVGKSTVFPPWSTLLSQIFAYPRGLWMARTVSCLSTSCK